MVRRRAIGVEAALLAAPLAAVQVVVAELEAVAAALVRLEAA
jgi:hypothetical protein